MRIAANNRCEKGAIPALKATFTGLGLVWCLMGIIMCVLAYTGSASKIWGIMGGAFIFLGLLTALGARKL
jgi:hypothetical protein